MVEPTTPPGVSSANLSSKVNVLSRPDISLYRFEAASAAFLTRALSLGRWVIVTSLASSRSRIWA
jgi:hypothetical protein